MLQKKFQKKLWGVMIYWHTERVKNDARFFIPFLFFTASHDVRNTYCAKHVLPISHQFIPFLLCFHCVPWRAKYVLYETCTVYLYPFHTLRVLFIHFLVAVRELTNFLKQGLSTPYIVWIFYENSTELDEVGSYRHLANKNYELLKTPNLRLGSCYEVA